MLDLGIIRRIGAVPNHYALGVSANGMSVWDVDDMAVSRLGAKVGALDFVSHFRMTSSSFGPLGKAVSARSCAASFGVLTSPASTFKNPQG